MDEKNTENPLVSVITVCFNPGNSIIKTIESVLAQSFAGFEYVIQDGKSTDDTANLIERYQKRFMEKGITLHYFREQDSGIYDAMNKAAAHANGVWVSYMNAGDCFYSADVLHTIFGERDYPNTAILYGDAVEQEYGRYYMFRKAIDQIEGRMPFSHQSSFTRRELLLRVPFRTDYRIGADYDFLLTVHQKGFYFTDTGTIVCIVSKDGISSLKLYDTFQETVMIRERHGIHQYDPKKMKQKIRELKLKQFVMDYFPKWIKKLIRKVQLKLRGQNAVLRIPDWERSVTENER
ncbi:MAG: glycosyltransferase family 2 protein [Lachnospiraceae bacterium]